MGRSTSYLGRVDLTPPLNAGEVEWLRAFAQSTHCRVAGEPYDVPGNPRAPVSPEDLRRVARVQGCDWQPRVEGCCLGWIRIEKSNNARLELEYLIDHFLRPEAHAAGLDLPQFSCFTFDHHASGVVVAEQDDDRRLHLLVVEDNDISEHTLTPADPMRWD